MGHMHGQNVSVPKNAIFFPWPRCHFHYNRERPSFEHSSSGFCRVAKAVACLKPMHGSEKLWSFARLAQKNFLVDCIHPPRPGAQAWSFGISLGRCLRPRGSHAHPMAPVLPGHSLLSSRSRKIQQPPPGKILLGISFCCF